MNNIIMQDIVYTAEQRWIVNKMKPMLSVKVIDSDTGIELDKVDKLIAPTELDYELIGEIIYRTYKWNFAYSIADNCALKLEEKMEKETNE